jgi:pimeloyl-ACP methyl ester carboxylesterase
MKRVQPKFATVSHASDDHGPIDLNVAVDGDVDAPLVLFVHGWPDIWHSWRHQLAHVRDLGYRVAAMDVRGYGASSKPEAIEAYRLRELCADTAAVISRLSPNAPAVLVGHDWGSPVVGNTARLHADVVRAVAFMSVPYSPASPGDPMEFWELVYPDTFFYMKYFQSPGVAERAFKADVAGTLRKLYYSASGDAPEELWTGVRSADAAFFDDLVDPVPVPAWMATTDLQPTIDAHNASPMHGAFNRYRAQYLDGDDIATIGEPRLRQPTCFIGGERDVVRRFVPGLDVYAGAADACDDFRGSTIIEGAGHWVHLERPEAVNQALTEFLAGLD